MVRCRHQRFDGAAHPGNGGVQDVERVDLFDRHGYDRPGNCRRLDFAFECEPFRFGQGLGVVDAVRHARRVENDGGDADRTGARTASSLIDATHKVVWRQGDAELVGEINHPRCLQ